MPPDFAGGASPGQQTALPVLRQPAAVGLDQVIDQADDVVQGEMGEMDINTDFYEKTLL